MSKAAARTLAQRCRALEAKGLDAVAAERQAFDEVLSESNSGVGIGPSLYEDFLQAYAPEQRRLRGVYYTPAPVVAAQLRLAADVLQQRLGCRTAFGDARVLVVDPATGSGAYPLAVLEHGPSRQHRSHAGGAGAGELCVLAARGSARPHVAGGEFDTSSLTIRGTRAGRERFVRANLPMSKRLLSAS